MPYSIEHLTNAGRLGGQQRANVLSAKELSRQGRKAANSRWSGLTAEERKAERAKGRAPKFETEPAARKKAAN
jgi:hypothetical protein